MPAPATALLLRGVPCRSGSVEGEFCTPTGAAMLAHFADEFGSLPTLSADRIGYGMGKKDFPAANFLRAFWGDAPRRLPRIAELRCNLDDMTPETMGFAMGALLDTGALDVFAKPIFMKRNRSATMLTYLCPEADAEKFVRLMLMHTTTLGVRKSVQERYALDPRVETVATSMGDVRVKRAEGFGLSRSTPEYDERRRHCPAAGNPPFRSHGRPPKGALSPQMGMEKPVDRQTAFPRAFFRLRRPAVRGADPPRP